MRRFLAFATVLALTACGGGGGSSPSGPSTPVTAPTSAPGTTSSNLVTPQFTIRVPAPGAKTSSAKRSPKYVSPSTLSVKITLNSDSAGINPTTITGNPAITNVNGTSGLSCTTGCTVDGPPSPPGTDNFTVTLYDATNATGNQLATATASFVLTAGTANSNPLTLNGIPASIQINGMPAANAFAAGTTSSAAVTITVLDADGNTITGTYASPVTLSDPDTTTNGSSVAASCPPPGTGGTTTSVQFTSDSSSAFFCYNGIAENDVTITASASGVSNATATFQPLLSAPVAGAATPAGVASGSEIDLFATSGTGSTGSITYSEVGWTNSPFNQQLSQVGAPACTSGGPLSTFATVGTANASPGTTFTATATGSPVAGSCPVTVGDGLTGNPSDTTATLTVTYTTTTIPVNGHRRVTH